MSYRDHAANRKELLGDSASTGNTRSDADRRLMQTRSDLIDQVGQMKATNEGLEESSRTLAGINSAYEGYGVALGRASRSLKQLRTKLENDDRYVVWSFGFFLFTAFWIIARRLGVLGLVYWFSSKGFRGAEWVLEISGYSTVDSIPHHTDVVPSPSTTTPIPTTVEYPPAQPMVKDAVEDLVYEDTTVTDELPTTFSAVLDESLLNTVQDEDNSILPESDSTISDPTESYPEVIPDTVVEDSTTVTDELPTTFSVVLDESVINTAHDEELNDSSTLPESDSTISDFTESVQEVIPDTVVEDSTTVTDELPTTFSVVLDESVINTAHDEELNDYSTLPESDSTISDFTESDLENIGEGVVEDSTDAADELTFTLSAERDESPLNTVQDEDLPIFQESDSTISDQTESVQEVIPDTVEYIDETLVAESITSSGLISPDDPLVEPEDDASPREDPPIDNIIIPEETTSPTPDVEQEL